MISDACELKKCPECGSDNVNCIESKDQLVCKDCGCIFEALAPEDEEKLEHAHEQGTEQKLE